MGCLNLTYHQPDSPLKVVHSNFSNERKSCAGEYRYGFNGMEKDDEVKGSGNSYDFGARMYDSRIGRWLSVDNYAKKYPYLSGYCYSANRPTYFVDYDGNDFGVYVKHPDKPESRGAIVIKVNVYINNFTNMRTGSMSDYAEKRVSAMAQYYNDQLSAVYKIKGENGKEIEYDISFEVNVVSSGSQAITNANEDNEGNSFSVADKHHLDVIKHVSKDETGEVVTQEAFKYGETEGNSIISTVTQRDPNALIDGIVPPDAVAQYDGRVIMTDIHELAHTLISSAFSFQLHNEEFVFTTSNEDDPDLLDDWNKPTDFFGLILNQVGVGNNGILLESAPNNSGVHHEGEEPVNFNQGEIIE